MALKKRKRFITTIVYKDNVGLYNLLPSGVDIGCIRQVPCNMLFMGEVKLARDFKMDEDCENRILINPGDEVPAGDDFNSFIYAYKFKDIATGFYYYLGIGRNEYLRLCNLQGCCDHPVYYNDGGIGEGNLDLYELRINSAIEDGNEGDPQSFDLFSQEEGFDRVELTTNEEGNYYSYEHDVTFDLTKNYTIGLVPNGVIEGGCFKILEFDGMVLTDHTSEWVFNIVTGAYEKEYPAGTAAPLLIQVYFVNTLHTIIWDWTFDDISEKTIRLVGDVCEGATIDFGDGETLPLILGDNPYTYPAGGTYQVSINYRGTIKQLNLQDNFLTFFGFDDYLPNHIELVVLGNNELTVWDNAIVLNPSLRAFNIAQNNLTEFDPSVALPVGLKQLEVYGMPTLTEFNPSIALPAGLEGLNMRNNGFTSFTPTIPIPASINNLTLSDNNFDSNAVNDILIYLDEVIVLSNAIINLETVMNVSPATGLGLAAKTNLEARGCTVLTD